MTSNKQSEIFYSEDDSSSNDGDEPLASGSREDDENVILAKPSRQGTVNLEPDASGEEGEDDQPTTPAHQVTDMFLFEVLAKMFIRSQIKLEIRVMTLEDRLRDRDQDVRIMRQELIRMQSQLAEAPGPPKVPQQAPRAQPRMGKHKTYSCHFCNFIFGSHDTEHCFRNPQRVSRPTPSGRGGARL